jgi:hypothetical protein
VTVIVSSTEPTRSSALTVAVSEPVNSIPSRWTVLKPGSVNRTVYWPGRRFSIRYRPEPSVTAERTFSIKAGLDASTVTPGSTAPDVSRTLPVIDACASASWGRHRAPATKAPSTTARRTCAYA